MKKKFMLRVMAWLLAVAMLLPSAGNLFTAYAEEGKVAYEGTVTFADTTGWTEKELTLTELIGNVAPDDVSYIEFSGDTGFKLGYNPADHGEWIWTDSLKTHVKSDIAFDGWYVFKFCLQKNADGKDYTINWKVVTGADEVPEVKKPTTVSDADYVGDYGLGYTVSVNELKKIDGDVKVTMNYQEVSTGYEYYRLIVFNKITGWPKLPQSDYAKLDYVFNSYDTIELINGESSISFVLKESAVDKIIDGEGGLGFQVYGIIITDVKVEAAAPKATATPKPTATPTPTPVPITEDTYKTVGDVLLVTEDMVKNGTVTVERAQYNSIIIPANLKADVLLKTVKADEVVVEGGADYTVTLYRCDIDKLDVTAPEVKVMTIAELNAALNAEDADTEAVIAQFQEDFAAKKAAEAAQVELVTTYFTTVKELNVKASAKIDTNDCEVDQINLAVADVEERMNVEVEEFNGAMSADLDRAEGAFAALFMLDLEDSKLSALDVTGADSSCFIEGKASVVDAINVADAANVTLNAATGKIVVGEKATGAKVRVYSDVNEVVVKGDANSIVLPTCAEIGNAVVEGNNVKIYGYGELESAVITGTGANVAVYGTAVEGDNDSTPPAAMIAMNPYKNLVKEERPSAPSEPEGIADTEVVVDTDISYGALPNSVPASAFASYPGAVIVDVYYHLMDGCEWGQFNFNANWTVLPLAEYNSADGGYFSCAYGTTSATFDLSAENVATIVSKGSVGFQGQNVHIEKIVIKDNSEAKEVEDIVTVIFTGTETETSYSTSDPSWFVNAADEDEVIVVYSAGADKNGWGIAKWGGNVNEVWTDGLEYSADGTDSTKEVTITKTVGELKEAMGITDDSTLGYFALGTYNTGKIISITLKQKAAGADTSTETVIFTGTETETSYSTSNPSWFVNAADEDEVIVVYNADTGKNGWGIAKWGGNVDEVWTDGLEYSADGTDSTKEVTVTKTVGELKEAMGITDETTLGYFALGTYNTGKIISITLKQK